MPGAAKAKRLEQRSRAQLGSKRGCWPACLQQHRAGRQRRHQQRHGLHRRLAGRRRRLGRLQGGGGGGGGSGGSRRRGAVGCRDLVGRACSNGAALGEDSLRIVGVLDGLRKGEWRKECLMVGSEGYRVPGAGAPLRLRVAAPLLSRTGAAQHAPPHLQALDIAAPVAPLPVGRLRVGQVVDVCRRSRKSGRRGQRT